MYQPHYVAPKAELVEMEMQGFVLTASGEDPSSLGNVEGMTIDENPLDWENP